MSDSLITPMRNVTCSADCARIFRGELTDEQREILQYIAERGIVDACITHHRVLRPLMDSGILKLSFVLDEQFKEYLKTMLSETGSEACMLFDSGDPITE